MDELLICLLAYHLKTSRFHMKMLVALVGDQRVSGSLGHLLDLSW